MFCLRAGLKRSAALSLNQVLNFSNAANRRTKARGRYTAQQQRQEVEPLPDFQALLRQLYKKSHPDLLRASHPQVADANDASMQVLNGILNTIKQFNEYPPQIIKRVPFHLRDKDSELKIVELRIQTAGGDCRRALTTSFATFFIEAGFIPEVKNGKFDNAFTWGKEYFPVEKQLEPDEAGMI